MLPQNWHFYKNLQGRNEHDPNEKNFFLLFFLISCSQENTLINGYIEGEYVYISPTESGILDEIYVVKGQQIKQGDIIFSVSKDVWQANIIQAQNKLDQAIAQYTNLGKGKRQQELDIIIEQKAQAEANFKNIELEYQRMSKLIQAEAISQAAYDKSFADYQSAKAKVAELNASLEAAKLSAREDELKSALNEIEIAKQELRKVKQQAGNNTAISKVTGIVHDVYFRLGETVSAGNPIVSILPPDNVKIRFYVSEKVLPKIKVNTPISVECDGCSEPISAKISYISTSSEYAPPVIYSTESRDKLLFLVEGHFDDNNQILPVGLPISVRLNP